jgi:putative aldouronate transport system substrate-binding protein
MEVFTMKKLLFVSMAFLAGAMIFAGGQQSGSSGGAASASGLPLRTIKILTAGDQPPDQQTVFNEVEKRTRDTLNIKLEALYTPWAEYQDKNKMMAAAGEVYDIFLNFSFDIYPAYVRKQAVRLNDLLDQYGQDIKKNISADDLAGGYAGNDLVAIPAVYMKDSVYQTGVIRADLRKKYNLPPVTDFNSFANFLDTIAKNEPNMSPVETGNAGAFWSRDIYLRHPEIKKLMIYGTDGVPDAFWYEEGPEAFKVKNYFESPYYTEQLPIAERGYNSHWWPQDLNKGYIAKDLFLAGKGAFINIDLFHFTQLVNDIKKTVPNAELEWVVLNPDKPILIDPSNNFAQICSTSKDTTRAMMFLNWIQASQENYDLWYWGIEGVHYTLSSDGMVLLPEGITGGGTASTTNPYNPTPWWFKNTKWDRPVNTDATITNDCTEWNRNAKRFPLPRTNSFVVDPANITLELAQINKIVKEEGEPLTFGQVQGQKAYQDFLAHLKAAGIDKVIAETQKQLDAYIAVNGIKK